MHAVHHTESIILKSTHAGEANKRLWLLTRDFGLIMVMVQGVRKSGAKLQSQIAEYSTIMADLVKGREVWRLVSAKAIDTPIAGKIRSPLSRAYVRTLSLLVRFIVGEGVHEEIFEHIKECGDIVKSDEFDAKTFDTYSIWKMLSLLGYVAPSSIDEPLLSMTMRQALQKIDDETRSRLNKEARYAISESHL